MLFSDVDEGPRPTFLLARHCSFYSSSCWTTFFLRRRGQRNWCVGTSFGSLDEQMYSFCVVMRSAIIGRRNQDIPWTDGEDEDLKWVDVFHSVPCCFLMGFESGDCILSALRHAPRPHFIHERRIPPFGHLRSPKCVSCILILLHHSLVAWTGQMLW